MDLIKEIERQVTVELTGLTEASVRLELLHAGEPYFPKGRALAPSAVPNTIYVADIHMKWKGPSLVKACFPLIVIEALLREQAFPSIFEFGTIVDSSAPSTILVKRLGPTRRVFIPFSNARGFDHRRMFEEKTDWNGLVEELNQDEELANLLDRLPSKVFLGAIDTEIGTEDSDEAPERCLGQLVPFRGKTFVALKYVPTWETTFTGAMSGFSLAYIKDLFLALQSITRHIIDFRHEAYLDGVVASRWMILDMLAKEYRKQFDTKSCSACGREIDLSRTPYYCPFCGQPLG